MSQHLLPLLVVHKVAHNEEQSYSQHLVSLQNVIYILPYVLFSPHSKYRLRVMFRLVTTMVFAGTLRLVLPGMIHSVVLCYRGSFSFLSTLTSFPVVLVLVPASQMESVLGLLSTCAAIFFGLSPLSSAGQIIRTKDSSPISRPTALALTLCALSWTIYGMILRQPWVAIPNVINLVLGGMQLILCLMYPVDASAATEKRRAISRDLEGRPSKRIHSLTKDMRERRHLHRAEEVGEEGDIGVSSGIRTSETKDRRRRAAGREISAEGPSSLKQTLYHPKKRPTSREPAYEEEQEEEESQVYPGTE